MTDDIKLPDAPLPEGALFPHGEGPCAPLSGWGVESLRAYARAAVLADRSARSAYPAHEAAPSTAEPLGWVMLDKNGIVHRARWRRIDFFGDVSRTQEAFTSEDVAVEAREWLGLEPFTVLPVFATPAKPAQAAQPLTDEQIDALPWGPHEGNPLTFAEGLRDFARAIERAHGIGATTEGGAA